MVNILFYEGFGEAEVQMGESLRKLGVKRSEYVLTTKLWKNDPEGKPNRVGLCRKHLL